MAMTITPEIRIIVITMLALYQSMSRPSSLVPVVLLVVSAAGFSASLEDSETRGHRVGLGDHRDQYELETYTTQSEAILPLGSGIGVEGSQRTEVYDREGAWLGLPGPALTLDPKEVALGRDLFFDRRLSANSTLSCGMCHIPEQGFTQQELATPVGHEGRSVRRNAPSLYNVAFRSRLFLDGREESLVAQVWSPLLAENEMANTSKKAVLGRINGLDDYGQRFALLYADGITEETLGEAIAAYQRSLTAANSRFDRWFFSGQKMAQTQYCDTDDCRPRDAPASADVVPFKDLAVTGFEIFRRVGCSSCHTLNQTYALFSDGHFHNTGTGFLRASRALQPSSVQLAPGVFVAPTVSVEVEPLADAGREEITSHAEDKWRYRTPSLRNVGVTSPYMHDGSIPTLREVVAFYNEGGGGDPNQDPRVRPLGLTDQEQEALVAFLESLTSPSIDRLVREARSTPIRDQNYR
jgi:cytochrome c peroxidase